MVDSDLIVILAKAPREGSVKTRLASAIGVTGALTLARAFLIDTLALAKGFPWAHVVLALDGDPSGISVPAGVELWAQGPGDLRRSAPAGSCATTPCRRKSACSAQGRLTVLPAAVYLDPLKARLHTRAPQPDPKGPV